jgi:heme/copper-type cytochrome/quinol oxidase subunit 2
MPFRPVFDQVFGIWTVIAGVVFALVTGILLVAIVLNRAKRRQKQLFRASKNTKLELGYAVLLGLVVAGLRCV